MLFEFQSYHCLVKAALLNYTGGKIVKERGGNITINCTADGIPQPNIVWRRNGQLIESTSRLKIDVSGGSSGFRSIPDVVSTTSILTITNVKGIDNGSYSCRADNEANVGAVLVTPFILEVIERKYMSYSECYNAFNLAPPTNFCVNSPCQNNGKCTNVDEGYICTCSGMFTGTNCNES